MKKLYSFKLIATIAVCAVISIVLVSLVAVNAGNTQAQNSAGDDETKQALRRGGLREAAKLKGHYVQTIDPQWDWTNFDIDSLVKHSSLVVVGKATIGKPRLSTNGHLVLTEYEVSVDELIKGTMPSENMLKITLPGGKVQFDDGTSAELITTASGQLTSGISYMFFLYEVAGDVERYRLTAGPQGLIELPSTGANVKSHGRSTDAVVKETQGDNIQSLHEKILKAVEKWPQPGTCCN